MAVKIEIDPGELDTQSHQKRLEVVDDIKSLLDGTLVGTDNVEQILMDYTFYVKGLVLQLAGLEEA